MFPNALTTASVITLGWVPYSRSRCRGTPTIPRFRAENHKTTELHHAGVLAAADLKELKGVAAIPSIANADDRIAQIIGLVQTGNSHQSKEEPVQK